ncbi:hypothetical protein [Iodobacter fluviatilis]|uniref:DUF4062 domain-containing protein n=1 Tax=Iodobacter fluviatilis TaxID=537 RepID=A0A377Q300_9NEIS|nr:hypothetical protein [Iodobacter fluviatilis]TCU90286.1 hypothetical protein EV682_101311 [Iodobacter fluviatilis]STQ89313.1 Uncharacterised protein [Iodobacter fluviatilis]
MAYQATVIPVMIASPGDVFEEREIVREVVHTWNYINSTRNGVVLMPAGWETHSSPELGSRAQELINSRVLKDCDLLIGVFWTRLGTPTGEAKSGTVEEIERHIETGKPAMIYFSSKPVALQSIDLTQYQALQEFKKKCEGLGLVEEFENTIDFKEKISRHLQLCIHHNPHIKSLFESRPDTTEDVDFVATYVETRNHELSDEAQVLLKAASKDTNGTILKIAVIGSRFIQAGESSFGGQGGRESARWEYALNELVDRNFVVERGHKGEVFELTHEGWALADTLPDDL